MKRKRTNSFNSSQQSISSIITRSKSKAAKFYLPEHCWEHILRLLGDNPLRDDEEDPYKYVSLVCKQFLSITNRLRCYLSVEDHHTPPLLRRLFERFTITILDLSSYDGNLDTLLCEISLFPLKITSLDLSDQPTIPAIGLRYFSQKITTLTSLTCTSIHAIHYTDLVLIADCFPNLEHLALNDCDDISEEGIGHVLRRCCKMTHLDLDGCSNLKMTIHFEVPNLKVLDLSMTKVNDDALFVISKNCRGILQQLLENCHDITEKGVRHVVENCAQLQEINLRNCSNVNSDVLVSLILSRPSLKNVTTPHRYPFNDKEMELLLRQGCNVY
ncbi:putative leucine-rich repeat domain, L domain-containing protein [Medicago truncatula]|uniref:F-box/RNI superfamily protein, putative n=1 Tax=Medicago truncatula TaxID=3880 RepID=A0A072UHM2_MEDTR|nr:F-box/LRR-repeat protein 4 [Medicago truncatula]KEH28623.1 F-box/RNI superfamily protein, putative [Medicago truncatula]RHN58437.1 putative leucine-rich repeat domain, L domain-containing protein [Medicago truncatula]